MTATKRDSILHFKTKTKIPGFVLFLLLSSIYRRYLEKCKRKTKKWNEIFLKYCFHLSFFNRVILLKYCIAFRI